MGKYEEMFKHDRTLFSKFSYNDWCDYYQSLNKELPPEKCPVELSASEKECYKEALTKLKKGLITLECLSNMTCQSILGLNKGRKGY